MPVHPYRPPSPKKDLEAREDLYVRTCLLSKLPASLTGSALGSCYRVIDAGVVRFRGRLFFRATELRTFEYIVASDFGSKDIEVVCG